MNSAFRLALIAVMLLTSQALAAARGQSRIAGEMVLCAGGELITVHVDAQGQPVERVVICPDMALNLMAAVGIAAPQPVLSETVLRLAASDRTLPGSGREAPAGQARGPPALA